MTLWYRYLPRYDRGFWLVWASLIWAGCGYQAPVIGQEDVLVIMASEADQELLEPLLTKVFERELWTPSPEPYFKILWVIPEQFETYRNYKNLIIASLAYPADSTGDVLIRKILGAGRVDSAMVGGNIIFMARDYLAEGQMFMGLTALDAVQASLELDARKNWIFDQFDQQLTVRQTKVVYRNGEAGSLMRELRERYSWGMRIQSDYLVIKEFPEENFVWLGRGYPYRWLAVHWLDQADTASIGPEWGWEQMILMTEDLFLDSSGAASIYIDSLFRSSAVSEENGHDILILRGVWAHHEQVAGGPFFTYVFRDERQNRIYFISGLVFNPGGLKSVLIKQQEIIARTFHTFERPPARVRLISKEII